jgi:hypothetical protein
MFVSGFFRSLVAPKMGLHPWIDDMLQWSYHAL